MPNLKPYINAIKVQYFRLEIIEAGSEGTTFSEVAFRTADASVPIPSAVWLSGAGLIGLVGFRRKIRKGEA